MARITDAAESPTIGRPIAHGASNDYQRGKRPALQGIAVTEIYLTRTLSGLSATDETAATLLRGIKLGKVVKADISQPRNIKHHRKFFALLTIVWQASGEWPSVEDLLIELKIKLGITKDVVIRESGEVVKIVGSISFSKMDQKQFDKFYEQSMHALCEIAGGIEYEDLRNEVIRQVSAG